MTKQEMHKRVTNEFAIMRALLENSETLAHKAIDAETKHETFRLSEGFGRAADHMHDSYISVEGMINAHAHTKGE